MSPDVWRAIVIAFLLCSAGSAIIGIMIAQAVMRRRKRRTAPEPIPRPDAANAPTVHYRPGQLWPDDAEQTLLLRREIPPPVHRARRRTW